VGKVALRNVLSKLASDASKAPPPPVESAGRVSVAWAGGQLYAFGDLCTCAGAGRSCPLSGGLLTRDNDHVPVSRLGVRHHH